MTDNNPADTHLALARVLNISQEDVAPDPRRTTWHRLAHFWGQVKGCVCSGVATQGSVHGLCVAFAAVTGVGGGAVSRVIPDAMVNAYARGAAGLTGTEIFQYALAPVCALAASYSFDKWRGGNYTWQKAGVTLLTCALAVPVVNILVPHNHDSEQTRIWLRSKPAAYQATIIEFARATGQTPESVANSMCDSDPKVRAEMERMKSPAYQRVLQHFALMPL